MRMPTSDILSFIDHFGKDRISDVTEGVQYLRMIKSSAEIEKIRFICKTKESRSIFSKYIVFLFDHF